MTVEEHQVIGGMGSAVAILAKIFPCRWNSSECRINGQSGTPDELVEHYGIQKCYQRSSPSGVSQEIIKSNFVGTKF